MELYNVKQEVTFYIRVAGAPTVTTKSGERFVCDKVVLTDRGGKVGIMTSGRTLNGFDRRSQGFNVSGYPTRPAAEEWLTALVAEAVGTLSS